MAEPESVGLQLPSRILEYGGGDEASSSSEEGFEGDVAAVDGFDFGAGLDFSGDLRDGFGAGNRSSTENGTAIEMLLLGVSDAEEGGEGCVSDSGMDHPYPLSTERSVAVGAGNLSLDEEEGSFFTNIDFFSGSDHGESASTVNIGPGEIRVDQEQEKEDEEALFVGAAADVTPLDGPGNDGDDFAEESDGDDGSCGAAAGELSLGGHGDDGDCDGGNYSYDDGSARLETFDVSGVGDCTAASEAFSFDSLAPDSFIFGVYNANGTIPPVDFTPHSDAVGGFEESTSFEDFPVDEQAVSSTGEEEAAASAELTLPRGKHVLFFVQKNLNTVRNLTLRSCFL